jgi:lycopene cyclase domain-containing protein
MSVEYAVLNAVFLAPLTTLVIIRRDAILKRNALHVFGVLCILTLLFDNLLIAAGTMTYDPAHIVGIKLGLVPIEDFAYTLAAVMLVALCWNRGQEQ